jgi:hypothetical protein
MLTGLPIVVQAAICFLAADILRKRGVQVRVSKREIARHFQLARSYIYEKSPEVVGMLNDGVQRRNECSCDVDRRRYRQLEIRTQVDGYRLAHPGCWLDGGRTEYSRGLVRFVLNLAEERGQMTQAEFAEACGIPLSTLKDWWRSPPVPKSKSEAEDAARKRAPAQPLAASESSPRASSPSESSSSTPTSSEPEPAPPRPEGDSATTPRRDEQATTAASSAGEPPEISTSATHEDPADEDFSQLDDEEEADAAKSYEGVRFSLQVNRIIAEYDRWHGPFTAFVKHLNDLGLPYGKALVRAILHLAAERKLLRKKPPGANTRGSTYRPPPNVQWSTDGKTCKVIIDGQCYEVNWQPMMDVGSGATIGSAVRKEENAAGIVESFNEGIETTGAPPAFLLADNKAPNKSEELKNALPENTTLMHATVRRAENKALSEGNFGLLAQELGPVIAHIDTSTPETTALSVADAVTRAFAQARNHRPRRKDGRTPAGILRNSNASPEAIADAIQHIQTIKDRIDARRAREEARRDPILAATLEEAFERFGFEDDGRVFDSLFAFSLPANQNAIAKYAAMQKAGVLPDDAGLRYFYGIARNCQYEIDLRLYEQELLSQLERTDDIVNEYLERRAAKFASGDLDARLASIVDELLFVLQPAAQLFWRRQLHSVAATVPSELRPNLRSALCRRIRSRFKIRKRHREQLIELVVRSFHDSTAAAA